MLDLPKNIHRYGLREPSQSDNSFPKDGYARIPHLPNLDRLTLPKGTTIENLDSMRTQLSVSEVSISQCAVTRRLMESALLWGETKQMTHRANQQSIAGDCGRRHDNLAHLVARYLLVRFPLGDHGDFAEFACKVNMSTGSYG
jgi:hypothetical protein